MTQHQIEKLLSQQAERLTSGQELPGKGGAAEPTSVDRAGLSADEQRSLSGLLLLARRVQAALVEVEPKAAFAADLKSRLMAQRWAAAKPGANGGRGMLWLWGVAGALSLAGLGFLGYRAARAGAGWISAAAANRNAGPALPKA
jgi:hypothetical protein